MRLGIFGGSFDPVHEGHLLLAECCLEQASLDKIWFLPTAEQPLKPAGPLANSAHRLAMLELACQTRPEFETSSLEIDRGGVSYSVDTLETIHTELPGAELFFLMGADSLADLPAWRRPNDICRLAIPLVVHRANEPEPDFEVLRPLVSGARLQEIRAHQVDMPPTPISSSEIRALIAAGGDWQPLVPRGVAEYVEQHGLYAA